MENPQSWDPDRYARNARFVSDLGMPVWSSCSRQSRVSGILDLGCGDGALTAKLVAMGCARWSVSMRASRKILPARVHNGPRRARYGR